jgi:long-chain acyl-CoA synthetase
MGKETLPKEAAPGLKLPEDPQSLGALCLWAAGKYKSRRALEFCRGDRLLETLDFRSLAFRSRQMAGLFRGLGLEKGGPVAILAENRPEWPVAAFGAALAGLRFCPLSPRPGIIRDLGEGISPGAICVTGRTGELASGMDPALPRIYLDSPAAEQGRGIRVSAGGLSKWLPLPGAEETLPKVPPEAGAVIWPGGREDTHRELLSLAARPLPRLFPRDRIISLSSLAEKGAFILGILAAVLGGASLNLPGEIPGLPEGGAGAAETVEFLRPSVLIGDAAFLENLYARKGAPVAEGPLSRNPLTRPLARHLGGRSLIRALGGNLRFYGFAAGPGLGAETERALNRVHLPRGKIVPQ